MADAAYVIGSEPCPLCRAKGEDSSGDNLKVYSMVVNIASLVTKP